MNLKQVLVPCAYYPTYKSYVGLWILIIIGYMAILDIYNDRLRLATLSLVI